MASICFIISSLFVYAIVLNLCPKISPFLPCLDLCISQSRTHLSPGTSGTVGSVTPDVPNRSLSYPQGHDDVFVVVGGFAGDGHLGLGVGVFEVECDPQRCTALAGSGGARNGLALTGEDLPALRFFPG